MRNKKIILVLMLLLVTSLIFTGCGNRDDGKTPDPANNGIMDDIKDDMEDIGDRIDDDLRDDVNDIDRDVDENGKKGTDTNNSNSDGGNNQIN